MKVVGMIPARLESRRLPEKALVNIMGLPMVIHTCKRAQMAKTLDDVFLATDSKKIRDVAESYDIKVIMTGSHHQTGSDRIAEAVKYVESDIVVNVQGDEPLVDPDHIDLIVRSLKDDQKVNVSLGVTPFNKKKAYRT